MKTNKEVSCGINKTKKHSFLGRFDLSDEEDYHAYKEITRRYVIIQIKEHPSKGVVYLEWMNPETYTHIFLENKEERNEV